MAHYTSGGIYFDTSTKGRMGHNHHSYRAEVRCEGRRLRRRFLSHSAAQKWILSYTRSEDMTKVCKVCGQTFEPRRDQAHQCYCSIECRRKAGRMRRSAARAAARAGLRCEHCGREFDAVRRRQKYCSVKCQREAYWKEHGGGNVSHVVANEPEREDASIARIRAYLALPAAERWARRAELTEAELKIAKAMYCRRYEISGRGAPL